MQDWTLENGNGVGVARMVDYRRPQVHSGPQTLQLLVDDVETVDAHPSVHPHQFCGVWETVVAQKVEKNCTQRRKMFHPLLVALYVGIVRHQIFVHSETVLQVVALGQVAPFSQNMDESGQESCSVWKCPGGYAFQVSTLKFVYVPRVLLANLTTVVHIVTSRTFQKLSLFHTEIAIFCSHL
jgi:hypothetical protein